MRNFFNMDNGFFRALGRLADLMILNISFIICCIPIVTIGASVTGMYYVTLKMAENEEGYIFKSFWKSFRQNFKQATIIWIIMLAAGCILALDFMVLGSADTSFTAAFRIVILAVALIYAIELIYVFPVLSKFDNPVKTTLRNAFIISIADLPRTFVMLVVCIGSVFLTFWNGYTLWYGLLIWVLAGFALIAYVNSLFLRKIFAKYIPKEDTAEADPDQWVVEETGKDQLDKPDA